MVSPGPATLSGSLTVLVSLGCSDKAPYARGVNGLDKSRLFLIVQEAAKCKIKTPAGQALEATAIASRA